MDKRIVFLDIDTQYDFMNPEGRLYVPGAEGLMPKLRRLFRLARDYNIPVISSLDTHSRCDPEFKAFPPHCIKGSRGHKKMASTVIKGKGQIFVLKNTFDVFSNPKIKSLLKPYAIVYVFGVALDYCVKAACLGSLSLGKKTYLVREATKAVSAKAGRQALGLLKQKGVVLISLEQLVKRLARQSSGGKRKRH